MSKLLEKPNLNQEQQKAFNKMKKAFNECKKLGVRFEQLDSTIIALNGKKIVSVEDNCLIGDDELELQDCCENSINLNTTAWVDCFVTVKIKV